MLHINKPILHRPTHWDRSKPDISYRWHMTSYLDISISQNEPDTIELDLEYYFDFEEQRIELEQIHGLYFDGNLEVARIDLMPLLEDANIGRLKANCLEDFTNHITDH